ncbi:hypothetical protein BC937DRAFT_89557 [Endogone sp. FLAS-F59071]|nr:hypothetical protein BC937DRAFT_89557 [Endogone sp. FLAS-F59071]|eukprot:RUS22359.1 hypothetical protein BC937DRAFT_89557 [Endogone sp. FLAS-F59071]
MHEIVTLQLGQFSNFVGAHFWNAQVPRLLGSLLRLDLPCRWSSQDAYFMYGEGAPEPEIAHDVLFRSGVTQRGIETYTPRLLVYDLKGALRLRGFGSLKRFNKLFENKPDDAIESTWDHNVQQFAQEQYPRNEYLRKLEEEEQGVQGVPFRYHISPFDQIQVDEHRLDEQVHQWSDYNRIFYHPHSINQLTQYQLDNEFKPFDVYSFGRDAYVDMEKEQETFDENFRFFTEECDAVQGFQLLTTTFDGFGGFARSLIEDIRDEYPKTPIVTFGFSNPSEVTKNPNLPYHTSALLSAGIENASLVYRLKNNSAFMGDLLNNINWRQNTKIGSLSLAFPLPLTPPFHGYNDGSKIIVDGAQSILKDLSTRPNGQSEVLLLLPNSLRFCVEGLFLVFFTVYQKESVFAQSLVLRGVPPSQDSRQKPTRPEFTYELLDKFTSINERFSVRYSVDTAYPLPDSFPRIFSGLDAYGLIDPLLHHPGAPAPQPRYVPVLSRLSTTTQTRHMLQAHINALRRINFKQFPEYGEGVRGVMHDDLEEVKEELIGLTEVYDES